METHLGVAGQVIGILIPLIAIAVAWGKYSAKAKEHDADIARLYTRIKDGEKNCNNLQREYLSTEQHAMLCKVSTMEIDKAIRESGDEIKAKVEETMIDFQKTMGEMFKELAKEVKNNRPVI